MMINRNENRLLGRVPLLVALCVTIGFTAGCTTTARLVDFTFLSTKNINLTKLTGLEQTSNRVTGVDTRIRILMMVTGVPNIKEAIDRAIESVPGGVALVDGTVESHVFDVLVYGRVSFVVEGAALVRSQQAMATPSETGFLLSVLNADGSVKASRIVNEEEYRIAQRTIREDGAAFEGLVRN